MAAISTRSNPFQGVSLNNVRSYWEYGCRNRVITGACVLRNVLSRLLHWSDSYNKRNLFERQCQYVEASKGKKSEFEDPYIKALETKMAEEGFTWEEFDAKEFFQETYNRLNKVEVEKAQSTIGAVLYTIYEGVPFEYGLLLVEAIFKLESSLFNMSFLADPFNYVDPFSAVPLGLGVGLMCFISPILAHGVVGLLSGKSFSGAAGAYYKKEVNDHSTFHPMVEGMYVALALAATWGSLKYISLTFKTLAVLGGHTFYYPALKLACGLKNMVQNQLYKVKDLQALVTIVTIKFIRGLYKDNFKQFWRGLEASHGVSYDYVGDVVNTIGSDAFAAVLGKNVG